MELRRYLAVLRRRLWLVVLLAVVGGVAGGLLTSRSSVYSTTATVYIGPSKFLFQSQDGLNATAAQQYLTTTLIPTYAQIMGSGPIAAEAARLGGHGLTGGEVQSQTRIGTSTNTTLITITAKNALPAVAQAEANGVADAFTARISSLQPQGGQGSVPQAPAYIFQRASLPSAPLPTGLGGDVAKGAVVGLILGIGLAGLLEYLDVTVKGPADAERQLQLAVLGVIPMRREDG